MLAHGLGTLNLVYSDFVNHTTGDVCHLNFTAYTYFSEGNSKKGVPWEFNQDYIILSSVIFLYPHVYLENNLRAKNVNLELFPKPSQNLERIFSMNYFLISIV